MNTRRKDGRMMGPAQISDNPSFKHALLQSLSVEVANPISYYPGYIGSSLL